MNNDTIIEGNKLIAEFMGCKEYNSDDNKTKIPAAWEKGVWYGFDNTLVTNRWTGDSFNKETPYHSSWDWLMPVVEKIENGARVDIYGKACKISQIQWDIDIAHINEHKITAVWLCVVDFIQWYNTQTKPHQ